MEKVRSSYLILQNLGLPRVEKNNDNKGDH